jgi:hypothetical protein
MKKPQGLNPGVLLFSFGSGARLHSEEELLPQSPNTEISV